MADLSSEVLEKLKSIRYDQILEKHEGPWIWESEFQHGSPEFLMVNNRAVLLPIETKQRPNIMIMREIISADGNTLTLFLKDTTYTSNPKWENYEAGRIAICERLPGEDFFVATVYHECFIVDNPLLAPRRPDIG
jgi:hypothetical protein